MVVACAKCEGRLEVPPIGKHNGEVGNSICAARCGHVFHIICLREFWDKERWRNASSDIAVPCPFCMSKYRPAVFELFLSTREATYVESPDEHVSEELARIRECFKMNSMKRDDLKNDLKDKENDLIKVKDSVQELRVSLQNMMKERNEAKEKYEQLILDDSMNKKLALDIFLFGNTNEKQLNKSFELIDISEESGHEPQPPKCHVISDLGVRPHTYNLRNKSRVCYYEP